MKKASHVIMLLAAVALVFPTTTLLAAKAKLSKNPLLTKYDANKNGKVDTEEYKAVRDDFAKQPKGELAKLDTNQDGSLSDDEIAAINSDGKKRAKSDADKAEKRARRAQKNKGTTETPAPATEVK